MENKKLTMYEKGFKLISLGMEIWFEADSSEFPVEDFDFEIGGDIEHIGWNYLSASPGAIFDDDHRGYHYFYEGVNFDGTVNELILERLGYRSLLRDENDPMNYIEDLKLTKELIVYRIELEKFPELKNEFPHWFEILDEVLLG